MNPHIISQLVDEIVSSIEECRYFYLAGCARHFLPFRDSGCTIVICVQIGFAEVGSKGVVESPLSGEIAERFGGRDAQKFKFLGKYEFVYQSEQDFCKFMAAFAILCISEPISKTRLWFDEQVQ